MWLVVALISMGLLIGTLVGMSAESVVSPLLGLLFAFGGGSVIALLGKIRPQDRKLAGGAILALSMSCLVGLFSGILISEYKLLSPKAAPQATGPGAEAVPERASTIADRKYLRSADLEQVQAIDIQYKARQLSASEAYEKLYAIVSEPGGEVARP